MKYEGKQSQFDGGNELPRNKCLQLASRRLGPEKPDRKENESRNLGSLGTDSGLPCNLHQSPSLLGADVLQIDHSNKYL